ncbi:MAG: hypothetical protein ACRDTA_04755 [Pseudonocardiaceae bacterium]
MAVPNGCRQQLTELLELSDDVLDAQRWREAQCLVHTVDADLLPTAPVRDGGCLGVAPAVIDRPLRAHDG